MLIKHQRKNSEYKKDFKAGKLQGKRLGRNYRFGGVYLKEYLENYRGIRVTLQVTPNLTPLASVKYEKLKRARDHKRRMVRIRWKILVRDHFTCQYCGRKAPQVALEVDHKLPFSKGGGNRSEEFNHRM